MLEPSSREGDLRQAAQESMRDPKQIRERVRALTLQALRQRQFDAQGFADVMRDMTEGISRGAAEHGQDAKAAVQAAFSGLDEALTRAAHASSLAVKEMSAKGREFSDTELRQGLDQLRRLETDFLQTWRQVASSASDAVKNEMQTLATHIERAGTGTGRVVAATLQEFSNRMGAQWMQVQSEGADALRNFSDRFSLAASGFLAAMSEVLKRDERGREK